MGIEMDLLVIRHGQSEADVLGVIEGRADFPLTELGFRQAETMANWLKEHYSISKIYSSPLKRAKQTAEYISKTYDIEVQYENDLMEWNNGLIAGLTPIEANEKYPEPKKHPHTRIYNQESQIDFRSRIETALSKIINENDSDETIVIVSHGGAINMLFRSFIESPLNSKITVLTGDTGIHHWRIKDNNRSIIYAGKDGHLSI